MRTALWVGLLCVVSLACEWSTPQTPETPSAPGTSRTATVFRGAGSCSAASCHGGIGPAGSPGTEHTTWIERDPHARAYSVLHEPSSKQIAAALKLNAAHESAVCLKCHVSPELEWSAHAHHTLRADGVSCEACHGPAHDWLAEHHTPTWRGRSKTDLGMRDTKNVLERVRLCVRCHVGTGDADVNHDLLAAGHPPLQFEMNAYHARMPKHWDAKAEKRTSPDLEARLWVTGQTVALQASLELLAARAAFTDRRRPWPELAEYNCSACHHRLGAQSDAGAGTSRSWPEWNGWHASYGRWLVRAHGGVPAFDARMGDLARLMNQGPHVDARQVSQAAGSARDALDPALRTLAAQRFNVESLRRLLAELSSDSLEPSGSAWEPTLQRYAGAVALSLALRDVTTQDAMPQTRDALDEARLLLQEHSFLAPLQTGERDLLRRQFKRIHREASSR